MSYTPKLFIRRSHLIEKRKSIEEGLAKAAQDRQKRNSEKNDISLRAYKEVANALDVKESSVIKFPEIELVVIEPQFTAHNERVRDILTTLEIEYRTFW